MIAYIVCAITGNLLYNVGALDSQRVIQREEVYRIFTSMFLHGDLEHLTGNMILLYLAGGTLERECGKKVFLVTFLISGLMGSTVSILADALTQTRSVSVGASGAVFGVVGALLCYTIFNRGVFAEVTTKRICFMIFYMLYTGFRTAGINNLAHVGGLIGGFGYAAVLNASRGIKEKGIYED